jgi:AhpD family alkylhydroperoxidase
MSRIPTPATIESAPVAAQPLLEGVKKQFGVVPNMFRLIANSPAALESYLDLSGALNKGTLPAPTRERIALAVAEINGCNYCLSAHTYLGKTLAKLPDAEITANRNGASNDPKAEAAVRFAVKVVRERQSQTQPFAALSRSRTGQLRSNGSAVSGARRAFILRGEPGSKSMSSKGTGAPKAWPWAQSTPSCRNLSTISVL